jgi:hypothetical protein
VDVSYEQHALLASFGTIQHGIDRQQHIVATSHPRYD